MVRRSPRPTSASRLCLLHHLFRVIVVTEIIETYFINRFFRVIVVTEIIKVYFLNRLSHVIVVTEIVEAYFRLAPPLWNRF